MNSQSLRMEIRHAAKAYAEKNRFLFDDSHDSAIIFQDLRHNFHPASFENMSNCAEWCKRIRKTHQNVPGVLEMQSSNSSDALLMNIFCHPDIRKWKEFSRLLNANLDEIVFGYRAEIILKGGKKDATEIDMVLPGAFCEAKLTESDFTRKRSTVVEQYDALHRHFHVEELEQSGGFFENYQVIRNLLASFQHNRQHILFCDARRPDLIRRYMQTIMSLKDVKHRKSCRVIFWQELTGACGESLRRWLEEKYGI